MTHVTHPPAELRPHRASASAPSLTISVIQQLPRNDGQILHRKAVDFGVAWQCGAGLHGLCEADAEDFMSLACPETYQINAPWAFTTVWSFVKPWLDEVTVSKIQILSSDYMKVLGQQIPVENLPKFLGGGCECPEGCTLSNAGPWQDKELVEKVKAKKVSQNGVTTEDVATGEAASTSPSTSTTAPAPAEAPGTAGGIVGEEKTKPEPAPSVTDNSLKGDAPPSLTTSSAAPAAASIPATASGIPMTVVESKVDA